MLFKYQEINFNFFFLFHTSFKIMFEAGELEEES